MRRKQYVGDGVYVDFDGFGFNVYTSNGIDTTNEIYLEPSVYSDFLRITKAMIEAINRGEELEE